MSECAEGGIVSGPPTQVMLDDDECVLDRTGRCIRDEVRHLFDLVEIHAWGHTKPLSEIPARCRHRACHVEPVESVVDGAVVARLCRACDAQLPA